jgi:hypothetical protein
MINKEGKTDKIKLMIQQCSYDRIDQNIGK